MNRSQIARAHWFAVSPICSIFEISNVLLCQLVIQTLVFIFVTCLSLISLHISTLNVVKLGTVIHGLFMWLPEDIYSSFQPFYYILCLYLLFSTLLIFEHKFILVWLCIINVLSHSQASSTFKLIFPIFNDFCKHLFWVNFPFYLADFLVMLSCSAILRSIL